jgi:hypothetical protein
MTLEVRVKPKGLARINHVQFGPGSIRTYNEPVAKVDFDDGTRKGVDIRHAKVTFIEPTREVFVAKQDAILKRKSLPPKARKKVVDPKTVRARAAKQVRVNTDRILDAAFGDAPDQSLEASQPVKADE